MRKHLAVVMATVAALAITATAAMAAAHFKRGGEPTCRDTGNELVCRGSLAGLGNQDLVIDVSSDAVATFECRNRGGQAAPGQNKIPFTATGSQTIQGSAIKNGNATFSVTSPSSPPSPTAEEAGCPNGNWRAVAVSDIQFSNVDLTISQGGQTLFNCTYPGTVPSDGSAVTLSC